MANPNQSVRTCILKVDLKCCIGCQKKASMKLQSISGVEEVEYNIEKGLMTVRGDVEPMALVRKLNKHDRKTELFSVKYQLDDDDLNSDSEDYSSSDSTNSSYDPKPMERQFQEKMMQQKKKKSGILKMLSLLWCFSSKSKVVQPLPMRNRNWHVPSKFENVPPGFGFNSTTSSQLRPPHPMMPYPPMMQPPMMQQQRPLMMQQQAQVPMPPNVNMFQSAPQPFKMHPKLHYGEQKQVVT
ncbi:putative heavy metal-associated domain, HMA, heavy metal-associated domain superfamily [Arabidopsis thaliana]|uniref:Heavy metal transport/detoxification superfamily protein n=4 Tax=Arabidopsis TaxID=3701 RepID=Q1G3T0_ARATH|nr:Heavy metal transport/detoxification superfamily protein [Arabidopsis thaliana]KAG7648032.1 Heavy metal-associated domain HMA [Arabidopsis thaliana x Arabidopsis arenosa]KAG7655958.1 Heavy metal-associated domain HMA [Arabidopsis suecica]ABF59207.1 unknown protein [Arabidopsis thaliana]AEE31226.1 Heavy metal transport/detoxification superfamily protein [Arabidopsis thaliana]OAP19096.1 hypothetical protein AXX17_AT1G30940 [Arabidopsis thaliana]|eukprot:NP_001031117.1 Heavy metal transport/detoxification superfamily protein [Arabidopsis thaliana]